MGEGTKGTGPVGASGGCPRNCGALQNDVTPSPQIGHDFKISDSPSRAAQPAGKFVVISHPYVDDR